MYATPHHSLLLEALPLKHLGSLASLRGWSSTWLDRIQKDSFGERDPCHIAWGSRGDVILAHKGLFSTTRIRSLSRPSVLNTVLFQGARTVVPRRTLWVLCMAVAIVIAVLQPRWNEMLPFGAISARYGDAWTPSIALQPCSPATVFGSC